MKKCNIYFILFLQLVLFLPSRTESQILFQEDSGKWETYGNAQWKFSDGDLVLEVKDGDGFLMTNETFKDFELELQFKPDSTINSGVFIRCINKELSATDCHEINIWDTHPNQDFRTGSIVTKAVPKIKIETLNKWNTYRIYASKSHIKVWLNDTLTAESHFEYPAEGYIALQAMGTGVIEFRNIKLKLLN